MPQKRTRQITLVLLASTSLMLASCDAQPDKTDQSSTDEVVFQTLAECEAYYSTEDCKANEITAAKQHEASAPKFSSRDECEARHGVGQCGQSARPGSSPSTASNVFMPLMLGYMMGSAMGSATRAPTPIYSGPAPSSSCDRNDPRCRTGGGGGGGSSPKAYYTGGGSYVGTPSPAGGARVPVTSPLSTPRSTGLGGSGFSATSRGGFGGTAAGHAGGGS